MRRKQEAGPPQRKVVRRRGTGNWPIPLRIKEKETVRKGAGDGKEEGFSICDLEKKREVLCWGGAGGKKGRPSGGGKKIETHKTQGAFRKKE